MEIDAPVSTGRAATLSPLPYHWSIREYLKKEEPELWRWFSSNKVRAEHAENVRLDLLKSTYRIEATTQPHLYDMAEEVLGRLDFKVPVTFYQAQAGGGLNAALAFLPGEAHIILVGSVLNTLSAAELKAMLGHEFAHFALFNGWDGELLVVSEILRALCNDAAAHACHLESSRLFSLYSEIFADRGALAATGDALAAIATLIKLETGLMDVSAESYLRQAEEIFSKSQVKASQLTHPEPYIRARALKLFTDNGEDANQEITQLIEGAPSLNELDLLAQQKVADNTRRLLNHFLAPPWFQTEAVLAHARLFFPDFSPQPHAGLEPTFADEVKKADQPLQDYYCYVLLDFVAVDRELEEAPLAAALVLCEHLGLGKRFSHIAVRELGMTKKRFGNVERDAGKILDEASASAKTS
jgi:hypothetical protein